MTEWTERMKFAWDRYLTAGHAVQSGIGALIENGRRKSSEWKAANPKHLRTGLDMSKVDQAALARLLIDKGVITEDEYFEALATSAEAEQARYEAEVNQALAGGGKITLA